MNAYLLLFIMLTAFFLIFMKTNDKKSITETIEELWKERCKEKNTSEEIESEQGKIDINIKTDLFEEEINDQGEIGKNDKKVKRKTLYFIVMYPLFGLFALFYSAILAAIITGMFAITMKRVEKDHFAKEHEPTSIISIYDEGDSSYFVLAYNFQSGYGTLYEIKEAKAYITTKEYKIENKSVGNFVIGKEGETYIIIGGGEYASGKSRAIGLTIDDLSDKKEGSLIEIKQ